tara:strand:+ start:539 stop:778 length:240 start_codon:yes stop_codon:yes gene_type:complete
MTDAPSSPFPHPAPVADHYAQVVTVDAYGACQPQRYVVTKDLMGGSDKSDASGVGAALEALASVDGLKLHGSGSAAWSK